MADDWINNVLLNVPMSSNVEDRRGESKFPWDKFWRNEPFRVQPKSNFVENVPDHPLTPPDINEILLRINEQRNIKK